MSRHNSKSYGNTFNIKEFKFKKKFKLRKTDNGSRVKLIYIEKLIHIIIT